MKEGIQKPGVLYLIPTPLGENPPLEVLPLTVKKIIEDQNHFIIENEKAARRFIKKIAPNKNQEQLILYPLNKFITQEETETYLDQCKAGISIGLFSDSGCPGIADPGSVIVAKAHRLGIQVKPIVGPSSLILAMMSSGMNGQNFAFNGYLPIDKSERKAKIKQLERRSFEEHQSQLFIETPYRNNSILEDLSNILSPDTQICVACDLTLPSEYIKTQSAKEWKHSKLDFHKRPAIFIIQKD